MFKMLSVDSYVRNRIEHVHPVSDGNSWCRLGSARHSAYASCPAGQGHISSYRPTWDEHARFSRYQNDVLFYIIFAMTYLVIWVLRLWTKWLRYQGRWCRILAFIEGNKIVLELQIQRFAADVNVICLTYGWEWWGATGPVIQSESKFMDLWVKMIRDDGISIANAPA